MVNEEISLRETLFRLVNQEVSIALAKYDKRIPYVASKLQTHHTTIRKRLKRCQIPNPTLYAEHIAYVEVIPLRQLETIATSWLILRAYTTSLKDELVTCAALQCSTSSLYRVTGRREFSSPVAVEQFLAIHEASMIWRLRHLRLTYSNDSCQWTRKRASSVVATTSYRS